MRFERDSTGKKWRVWIDDDAVRLTKEAQATLTASGARTATNMHGIAIHALDSDTWGHYCPRVQEREVLLDVLERMEQSMNETATEWRDLFNDSVASGAFLAHDRGQVLEQAGWEISVGIDDVNSDGEGLKYAPQVGRESLVMNADPQQTEHSDTLEGMAAINYMDLDGTVTPDLRWVSAAGQAVPTTPDFAASLEPSDKLYEMSKRDLERARSRRTIPLTTHEELLYVMEKKGKRLPSVSERRDLVKVEHEHGHFGRDAMYDKLMKKGVWWPNMRQDIENEIEDCDNCLGFAITRKRYHKPFSTTARRPGGCYAFDLLELPKSRHGHTHLLGIIDICSGFTVLSVLNDGTSESIARGLLDMYRNFGPSEILISDKAEVNVSQVMECFNRMLGVQQRVITPYHPQANGKVERMNQSILTLIKKVLEGSPHDWPIIVPFVQIALNNKITERTGKAAYEVMFGRTMNEFQDYRDGDNKIIDFDQKPDEWLKHLDKILSVIYPAIDLRGQHVSEKYLERMEKERKHALMEHLPKGTLVITRNPLLHQGTAHETEDEKLLASVEISGHRCDTERCVQAGKRGHRRDPGKTRDDRHGQTHSRTGDTEEVSNEVLSKPLRSGRDT